MVDLTRIHARTSGSRDRSRPGRPLALAVAGILAAGALAACAGGSDPGKNEAELPTRTVDPGKPISDQQIEHFNVGIMGKIPQLDPVENIGAVQVGGRIGARDKEGDVSAPERGRDGRRVPPRAHRRRPVARARPRADRCTARRNRHRP